MIRFACKSYDIIFINLYLSLVDLLLENNMPTKASIGVNDVNERNTTWKHIKTKCGSVLAWFLENMIIEKVM